MSSLHRGKEHFEDAMQAALERHDGTKLGSAFSSCREIIGGNGALMCEMSAMMGGGSAGRLKIKRRDVIQNLNL
jgi:hypothetical protein